MLTRHQLRVRVYQTLYARSNNREDQGLPTWKKKFDQDLKGLEDLHWFLLYLFRETALFEPEDLVRRQKKLKPSEADQKALPLLSKLPLIDTLCKDEAFEKLITKQKFSRRHDMALIRKLFREWIRRPGMQERMQGLATPKAGDKPTLEFMRYAFQKGFMRCPELNHYLEEQHLNWEVENQVLTEAAGKSIERLSAKADVASRIDEISELLNEDIEFGRGLLKQFIANEAQLDGLVQEKSKNWDKDRLALSDNLLLKMALTEFQHFPSIPVKVSINEYLDISKRFSTPKSKSFINGVLDNLLKELTAQGKIVKTGRGLIDKT